MSHIIKKIFIIILLIAIICGTSFIVYRYKELKAEGKLDEVFASNKNDNGELDPSTFSDTSSTPKKTDESDSNKEETKTDDRQFIVEEKNYDDYYNKFIFDNVLLLYEGEQSSEATREALDRLIRNADDPMYSKPAVILENIGGLSSNQVSEANLEEYKKVLSDFRSSLGNDTYNFSFEYAKFSTIVNKITITKK